MPRSVTSLFFLFFFVLISEEYQDEEHQKRLAAFERAGVENYLYWKRCENENKIDKKADNMLQR